MRSFKRGQGARGDKRKRGDGLDSKFGSNAWPFKPDEKDYDDGEGKGRKVRPKDTGRWDGKATHES